MATETMTEEPFYELVNVVRRLGPAEAVVYRCLKKLPSAGYVVQSADRVRLPVDQELLHRHETQFWELLLEERPDIRGALSPTLEEAIAAFHASFE
jgi:DNA-binding IclR family transcriptional regulator